MTRQARLIRLPDGTPVWARIDLGAGPDGDSAGVPGTTRLGDPAARDVPVDDTYDPYDDYQDVGALDGALARVSRLRDLITGVAASVRDAAAQAEPDEVGVEFGVEFAVRGGAIVSVLADAQSTGTLKVTLTWKDRRGRATPPPRAPAPPPVPSAPPVPAAPPPHGASPSAAPPAPAASAPSAPAPAAAPAAVPAPAVPHGASSGGGGDA